MKILNRRGRYDYIIDEEYIAGLILFGSEVKSILNSNANFSDSYVFFKEGELYVTGLNVSRYKDASYQNHEEDRIKKILLNKKEIKRISKALDVKGFSMIPLELFLLNGKIKLKLGVGKGKRDYDRRETIKKRDIEREYQRKF